jgi:hypothetical protein
MWFCTWWTRTTCFFRTIPVALTGAAQLRADGISSCYIVNVHNQSSWPPSCKAWCSSRPLPSLWASGCYQRGRRVETGRQCVNIQVQTVASVRTWCRRMPQKSLWSILGCTPGYQNIVFKETRLSYESVFPEAKFVDPDWRIQLTSAYIGLSLWPAAYVAWRAGTSTLCRS